MSESLKAALQSSLQAFATRPLVAAARGLLAALGYPTESALDLHPNSAAQFCDVFDADNRLHAQKALLARWRSVDMVCQVTDEEIGAAVAGQAGLFQTAAWQSSNIASYLFFVIDLEAPAAGSGYTRTQLAAATREINKLFLMPAMVIFRHGDSLTFAIIARRLHKRDASKDVLEKVTLIKGIRFAQPHRAHLDILADLALPELAGRYGVASFADLQTAWEQALDTAALNKRFYQEVANWYFWATDNVTFPDGAGEDAATGNAVSVIRLITRLIFVWFLKEKGLVPEALFRRADLEEILTWDDPQGSTYYKAILQNLFFATLNTYRTCDEPDPKKGRRFRGRNESGGQDSHYGIHTVYRYLAYFRGQNEEQALAHFADIPFLNGGLFECLDRTKPKIRIDGFSDRSDNPLTVPDSLFFSDPIWVNLDSHYGTKGQKYRVRGLLRIFESYKFTVEENTPIEEEIALDPELLGRVFENLLAAYNPETGETARKQTGSFYTPRMIVDYMVDESLLAHLAFELAPVGDEQVNDDLHNKLRGLLDYTQEGHDLNPTETDQVIAAIDNLKILDPACGSGAFPMGVLHKLVFILGKLDPHNESWQRRQIERAWGIEDADSREKSIALIEHAFRHNYNDYGRKLYLIENCIYGVDIQPIAVQIAKLRFFISLVVDQKIESSRENRGIRALPNLETKFVAANTLVGINRPPQLAFRSPQVEKIEHDLANVRRHHFSARTQTTKERYRDEDKRLRTELVALLEQDGWPKATAAQLAAWDPYDQNKHSDFFDPEWMFGVTDGFDITIGNPPYVRADASEEHVAFRRRLEASKRYETLWEKWDLFIPFIEIGYKLLRPGGITTMIVSDAYCHAKYAQKSQTWFLQNSRILRLDFLNKIKVFDAAVRNVIYIFQKVNGQTNSPERRIHEGKFGQVTLLPTAAQSELTLRAFFPEGSGVGKINVATLPVEALCYVSFGCRPNSDEKIARGAFVVADLLSHQRDPSHPKPYIEAKDMSRWVYRQTRWLEWGTKRSPSLLARPTFEQLYEVTEKIIAADVSGAENRAAYDSNGVYHSHTLISFVPWYGLAGVRNQSIKKAARYHNEKQHADLPKREQLEETSRRFSVKYLLAVMNSSTARDFLRANRRSNIHLYPDDWKALPIPDVPLEKQQPLVTLVDHILTAKAAEPGADVSAWEAEIDRLVYALYGLNEEEIRIVEGS